MKKLLLPTRRRVLAGAITAPFIWRRPSPLRLVGHGGGPPPPPPAGDVLVPRLAAATLNQWTGDLVAAQGGNHLSDILAGLTLTSCNFPGGGAALSGSINIPALCVFGGTCYGAKQVFLAQCTGHGNGPWNASHVLSLAALSWALKDAPTRYKLNTSANSSDPSNPVVYGNQPADGYTPWPNTNGHLTQGAGHNYGYSEYLPNIGKVFLHGTGNYSAGGFVQGWGRADATSGQYEGVSGNSAGGASGCSIYVSETGKLFINTGYKNGGNPVSGWAGILDPSSFSNSFAQTHRMDASSVWPDGADQGNSFVLIPDPNNAGTRAVVCFAINTGGVGREAICYFPKVSTGLGSLASTTIGPNPWTVPANLQESGGTHKSSWVAFLGDFKGGSTKILIVNWQSTPGNGQTGLYLLDTGTWAFTALPNSTLPVDVSVGGAVTVGNKLCYVPAEYVVSPTFLPIGLTNPNNGEEYFYPLSWGSF